MPATPQDATTVVRLRLGVGIIAALLPILVTVTNMVLKHQVVWLGSISVSYYTNARGIFVGSLCALGLLLICYRYDKPDDRAASFAGFLAIVVALFPTAPDHDMTRKSSTAQIVVGAIHFTAAALLFLTLAYFCFFLFTRTRESLNTAGSRKAARNLLYRICGGLIVVSLAGAGITYLVLSTVTRAQYNTLFWFETVMVWAFAAGWLVKGGLFLKDRSVPPQLSGDTAVAPPPRQPEPAK
jgi:hypothetical protein